MKTQNDVSSMGMSQFIIYAGVFCIIAISNARENGVETRANSRQTSSAQFVLMRVVAVKRTSIKFHCSVVQKNDYIGECTNLHAASST